MSSVRTELSPVQETPPKVRTEPVSSLFVHVEKNLASLGFFTPSTKDKRRQEEDSSLQPRNRSQKD
jgi:hypothetical protein